MTTGRGRRGITGRALAKAGLAAGALLLVGCSDKADDDSGAAGPGGGAQASGEASVSTVKEAELWANVASAPAVLGLVYYAELLLLDQEDSDCPAYSGDGNTDRFTGDCTDSAGTTWTGSYELLYGQEATTITLDNFGSDGSAEADCPGSATTITLNGLVTLGYTDAGNDAAVDLEVRLLTDAPCEAPPSLVINTDYDMSIAGNFSGGPSTWNGAGTVSIDGEGIMHASTVDERLDQCGFEADSGATTLVGADTVVLTYDGATDCDEIGTVQWSLNGEDQGELSGVACSALGGLGATWTGALALLGLLGRRRERGLSRAAPR